MSKNVGASASRSPKGLRGLYRDKLTLPYYDKMLGNITGNVQYFNRLHENWSMLKCKLKFYNKK
jgi:hypothetical protein